MTTAELFEQALRLSADERRALADTLTASLGRGPDISPELAQLIDDRLADVEANPDAWRSADEAVREARARYLPL